jgi:hypothetical protein
LPKIFWAASEVILMSQLMRDKPDYYDFDGIRLFLTENYIEHLASGKTFTPSINHRQFLLVLARNAPDVVSYEKLWKEVWQLENFDDSALKNIRETKRQLVIFLKNNGVENPSIVAERGYRLSCEVLPGYEYSSDPLFQKNGETKGEIPQKDGIDEVKHKIGSWKHNLTSNTAYIIPLSIFYGFLFLVASILEVAYEFDTYGKAATIWGTIFTLINGAAFFLACGIVSYRLYYKRNAFLIAVGILLGAVLISILLSTQFLPFRPVTQANYQTQPSFIAFGKNALVYFFSLAVLFLLLPFYTITSRRLIKQKIIEKMPSDIIFIKPQRLLIVCIGEIVFSALTTNYMLDKLDAQSIFHTLFVGMIVLRFVVYFGLALSSLAWYHTQIKKNPD